MSIAKKEKPDTSQKGGFIIKDVPKDYKCNAGGVWRVEEDEDNKKKLIPITRTPVVITARTAGTDDNNHGIFVEWITVTGNHKKIAIPARLLNISGTDIAQALREMGLDVVAGKEKELRFYLDSFSKVKKIMVAADCTGWEGNSFVLPNETINNPPEKSIVFQPNGQSNTSQAIKRSGTLKAWQEGIKSVSPLVKFLICTGFAAPVMSKVNLESGGFHIYKGSSKGKTTAALAACSVSGSGASKGKRIYIQQWSSTANALEAVLESFNNMLLCLDELGIADPRDIGRTIYRIFSGTGKNRLSANALLKDTRHWETLTLSTGEISMSDFITRGGGEVKGGMLARMVDIPVSGVELFKDAVEADSTRELVSENYGHALPEFLSRVTDFNFRDFDADIGKAETVIAGRVRKRFAVVAYAGVLAVRCGVLPWTEEEVIESTQLAYALWYENINSVSDTDRGVASVKDFILRQASRFEGEEFVNAPVIHNKAGWLRDDMYHFIPSAFKESCEGANPTEVKRLLNSQGLLHLNKTRGFNSAFKLDGKTINVVSVKSEIIAEVLENSSNCSNRSNESSTATVSEVTTSSNGVVTCSNPENEVTTGYHMKNKVVTAESQAQQGQLPRLLQLPPKTNTKENNTGDAMGDFVGEEGVF